MLLRSMRKGFFSAVFLGLLVLGGVSLVFTDWNGMFRGGINKTDVAKVDGTPIKIAEFNTRVNRILHQQQLNPAAAYQLGLIDNILRQEIFEILLKKNAADLGIRVEDRIIANQVKDLIAPLEKSGMSDKDALKQFLEMQGMSEAQLTTALRDDLTTKILKATITSGTYVPKSVASDILAYKNETRSVNFAFYPDAAITIKDKPSDAELEKYYQGMTASFMIPESRDVTVAILDTSKISKSSITDADIRAAYDENQDSYMNPETVDVEQALIQNEKQAAEIADATKSGTSLKDAVKKVTGSDKDFQGKNNFAKDGLPGDIATPVFAAKDGDVVGPVQSPLGYHVIRLVKKNVASPVAFEKVQDKIRKELEDQKSGDALYDVTSKIEDRLANGDRFEDMKSEYPLNIISLRDLTQSGNLPKELDSIGQGSAKLVLTKAFAVTQDAPSELSELADTNKALLFSVRLDKSTPARPKAFSDVKETVLKKWIADNQSQENLLATQKLVDDLNAGKTKDSAVKFQTVAALTRAGVPALAKDVTASFMSAEKGSYIMAISKEKNGVYIGHVSSITLGKDDGSKDADMLQQLESDVASSGYMGYLASLQKTYSVTINDGLLKRVYGTPENSDQ